MGCHRLGGYRRQGTLQGASPIAPSQIAHAVADPVHDDVDAQVPQLLQGMHPGALDAVDHALADAGGGQQHTPFGRMEPVAACVSCGLDHHCDWSPAGHRVAIESHARTVSGVVARCHWRTVIHPASDSMATAAGLFDNRIQTGWTGSNAGQAGRSSPFGFPLRMKFSQ